jgi:L-lactate dehydrogenase complex protein LldG
MSARANILRRLASADFRSPLPAPDVSRYYATHTRREEAAGRLARFKAAITAAHAEVHDTDDASWPALLTGIMLQKQLKSLLVGTGSEAAQAVANAANGALDLRTYDTVIDSWRSELFTQIDAGLTRARSAIAETGSLVLWPDVSEPRLMSLVPPVHFVLLDAGAIHADLFSAMTTERWTGNLPTNALLISGPSKTADIQQTLAYGAHGPRELVVLVVHAAKGQA